MTKEDQEYIETSIDSGNKYGYPKCCIDAFVAKTPSQMKASGATQSDRMRYEAAHINGEYTGFIPCTMHAIEIKKGKITLLDLIDKNKRLAPIPFPNDWSFK